MQLANMADKIDNNLIVFESNPDFSDNPRAIYDYAIKNSEFRCVWITRSIEALEPLRKMGVEAYYRDDKVATELIASAKYLISASFEFASKKKDGQFHLSTWHGLFKLVGFFESAEAVGASFQDLKVATTMCDMILASSTFTKLLLAGCWACDPRKVIATGYPRNDYIYKENGKENLRLLNLPLNNDPNLVLYLPTMRKGLKDEGVQFENNIFNFTDYSADEIDAVLEDLNAYIIAKLHFADYDYFKNSDFKLPRRLIFLNPAELVNSGLTVYHILNAFDVLVTDYSSIFFDYLLLDRPMVFTCSDLETYIIDRGFIADNPRDLMPGPDVANQSDFLESLVEAFSDPAKFQAKRKWLNSLFNNFEDSCSSERAFNAMITAATGHGLPDSNKSIAHEFMGLNPPLKIFATSAQARVYFDVGEGYDESTSIVIPYKIQHGDIANFKIDIPFNAQAIRFDPDEYSRVGINKLRIKIDDESVEYSVPGAAIRDGLYIYDDIDPKIIISVNKPNKRILHVEFEMIDLATKANSLLVGLIDELNHKDLALKTSENELTRITHSRTWRIVQKFKHLIGR